MRAIVVREDRTLVMHRNKFGLEYYTLIGGGVDTGETLEQALKREIQEETGFTLLSSRLVFVEQGGSLYGPQHIYLCEVAGQQPALGPQTEEAQTARYGNLYEPMWLELQKLNTLPFRSERLRQAILYCSSYGWPKDVIELDDRYVSNMNVRKEGG